MYSAWEQVGGRRRKSQALMGIPPSTQWLIGVLYQYVCREQVSVTKSFGELVKLLLTECRGLIEILHARRLDDMCTQQDRWW